MVQRGAAADHQFAGVRVGGWEPARGSRYSAVVRRAATATAGCCAGRVRAARVRGRRASLPRRSPGTARRWTGTSSCLKVRRGPGCTTRGHGPWSAGPVGEIWGSLQVPAGHGNAPRRRAAASLAWPACCVGRTVAPPSSSARTDAPRAGRRSPCRPRRRSGSARCRSAGARRQRLFGPSRARRRRRTAVVSFRDVVPLDVGLPEPADCAQRDLAFGAFAQRQPARERATGVGEQQTGRRGVGGVRWPSRELTRAGSPRTTMAASISGV